ncbi:MAG: hypothetical protein F6K65_33740 [Moorea sp. SIO3C2]|nr:hypothetical protein [Moorena sp. SIO3C2]
MRCGVAKAMHASCLLPLASCLLPLAYPLHPTPYTLHPTPYSLIFTTNFPAK